MNNFENVADEKLLMDITSKYARRYGTIPDNHKIAQTFAYHCGYENGSVAGDQDGYERGYKQGWDKGYSNGEFLGRAKLIKEMKQFMLETFGGDDGTGNLNKIYEHLDELWSDVNEKA